MRVSIIVTTRNSVETLHACLESIRRQVGAEIESIVVDNHSTDGTIEIARGLADRVIVRGPERSAQRNHGVEQASGRCVLIIDSDMILAPTVVAECVAATEGGATAVTIPEISQGDGLWGRAKALERSCYVGDEDIEAPRFFPRETYLAYGGYDTDMVGGEDWDLPARMRGRETFSRTAAFITHLEGRPTLRELARKKYYYGQGFARYISKNPRLATRQVARPAYARHWRRLARTPVLTAAMLGMKTVEYIAGGLGVARGLLRSTARKG